MMKPPFLYTARIMAQMPGDSTEIELFRSSRPLSAHDFQFCTRDMDDKWEIWTEHHTPEKHVIGGRRAIPYFPHARGEGVVMLRPEENAALEEAGVMPAYKESA
jgi:hypothetical protein